MNAKPAPMSEPYMKPSSGPSKKRRAASTTTTRKTVFVVSSNSGAMMTELMNGADVSMPVSW